MCLLGLRVKFSGSDDTSYRADTKFGSRLGRRWSRIVCRVYHQVGDFIW